MLQRNQHNQQYIYSTCWWHINCFCWWHPTVALPSCSALNLVISIPNISSPYLPCSKHGAWRARTRGRGAAWPGEGGSWRNIWGWVNTNYDFQSFPIWTRWGGWMSIYRLFFCEHQGAMLLIAVCRLTMICIRQSSSLAGDYSQINWLDGKTIWLMDSRRFKSLLISIPICAFNVYITYKQVQVNLECYHHPFPFRNAKKSCPHGGCWNPKKTAHWQQNTLASWLPIWRKCGNPHGITIQLTLEAPKSVKIWLVSNILGFSHFGSIFGIPLGWWHQITVNFGEWRNRNVPGPRARVGHRVWPPFWDPPAAQQWHPCSGCHGAGALGVPSAGQNSRGKGILDHLGSTFHLFTGWLL